MDSQTNPWEGTGYDGMYAAYSSSYVNGSNPFEPGTVLFPDNWMISQEFTVPAENAVLSWYHSASDPEYNQENYSVYVGNGTDPSGYTEVVYNGYPTNTEQGEYQNVTVDLSAYAGQTVQLAFRHHDVSDMYMLVIDYITVSGEGDVPPVTPTPVIPTPTPDLPGEGFVETNEIIPGEQYIIAVDYNGQIMMMSNVLDADNSIRLVGDPAQMSGNAIVGGYSDNHLWTFSSETAGTIQSVGNGRYCEVVNHNGYAWLGLADSASYNWTWDGNGNMVTDAPHAGQWNHLSYAETATDIDHPAFDLWVYGEPDYLPIKLYKASGDVPPVTPTPDVTPTPPPVGENAFEDSFENGLVNWTLVDADNDGNNWMGTYNTGWSGVIPAQDGSEAAFSQSYINYVGPLTPDNWMISTEFTVPAEDAVLSWYHSASDVEWNEENYSVYVGHGNDPSGYTEVVYNGYPTNTVQGEYQNVTVDLSAYAGQDIQIAFRHHNVSDMYILLLDNVVVSGAGDVPPVTPTPDVTPTPPPAGDLDEALNVEGGTLTFTNDEVYPWEVRDNYAASGNAGVVSSSSTVTTTVELAEGEALFFDWSTSSEANYDKLIFSVDGTAVRNISGEVDWTQFYYVAPAAGTYTFTWSYTKDGSVDRNNDEGYLDNVYVGEAPEVPEADLYAFNSFEESWITFNSADPSMAAPVGAPGATVFAAEYVDGTVYGYTNEGQFFTTTLNNMSNLNVVGTIGEVIVDMAYNYATGMMYAIGSSENQEGPRTLYTVDLATGGITAVGSLDDTAVAAIMTLGITTEGEAYGISFAPGNQTNDSYLHTINLETAECEAIGPTGFPINYVQTMTYDHNNDQMLWAQFYSDGMFTQTSALVAVNLETGAGTQLGSTPVGGEVGELLGMFSVPGEGPTPPPGDYTVEVGTVEANPGSTVRIPVTVNGLAAAAFELSYDADMFTYVGYTNPVAEAFVTVNDLVAGELTIAMMNYEANYEGEAIILEFAVAGECEDGEYEIPVEVISAAAIIDGATTNIDVSEVDATAGAINVVNGYTVTFMYNGEIIAEVTVPVGEAAEAPEMDRYIYDEETGYYHVFCGWDKDFSSVYENMTVNAVYGILGDVNNDGTVNITDATMLMRGVVGMETLSELQDIIADVNCDGSVGISDATLIARFVTGLETFPVPMD